jgi:hypothetical protein
MNKNQKYGLLEVAKITNELKQKELNIEQQRQINIEERIKVDNKINKRNYWLTITSILIIGLFIFTLTIISQRQRINIDCSISGINYEQIKYTDITFNHDNINLNNSVITCKGNIDITNLALIIGG